MVIEVGDIVKVVDRTPGPADLKSGLFYNHFRNLAGVVDRVYDDGAVCVIVEYSTLKADMLARLRRAEKAIKPRWKPLGANTPVAPPAASASGDAAADTPQAGAPEVGDDDDAMEPLTAAPPPEEPPAEAEDNENGKIPQGLRYAIVVKAEDVKVTGRSNRPAAGARN